MKLSVVDWILNTFSDELPDLNTMDEYIDYIMPKVIPFSEDLFETEFYTEKAWLEVRDSEQFLDAVLHIFKEEKRNIEIKERNEDEGPDYLKSVEGNVTKGSWTFLKGQNAKTLLIKTSTSYELYEKVFINLDFFILKKHGYKHKGGNRKYFFMGRESLIQDMEWREIMELLYNIYRYRSKYMLLVAGVAILVVLILIFSLF